MNPEVTKFLKSSKAWREEMAMLRSLLLEAKLEEDLKWGKPCYSAEGNNIAIMQPFKGCLGLMFFKGMLLKDTKKLLVANGPNSQSSSRLEFASVDEIAKAKPTLKAYIKEALALEKAGVKVERKKRPEPMPEELKALFSTKPKFKAAFEALTPGRQRAYILHFSSAKQSATRQARIEKCMPDILAGKGFNER